MGNGYSIYSAELLAIYLALLFMQDFRSHMHQLLISVDSLSVLDSLQNWDNNTRPDLLFDIKHQIHALISAGIFEHNISVDSITRWFKG